MKTTKGQKCPSVKSSQNKGHPVKNRKESSPTDNDSIIIIIIINN